MKARRISFVTDSVYPYNTGGKEKRLFDLACSLRDAGHDVHIYTMKWWDEPGRVKVESGVTLHALCGKLPMYSGDRRSIWQAIRFSIASLRMLAEPWDVVDVDHMPYFPVLTIWLVAQLRGKTFHATWHEALDRETWVGYMGFSGHLAFAIERLTTKLPRQIGTASEHTRDTLAQNHGRSHGVHYVGTGIDLASIAAAAVADVSVDILFVGRFVKDKHVDVLIAAMPHVLLRAPTARCVLIGHGPERERLSDQITSLQLAHSVELRGPFTEARDIYSVMKRAKVFVLPSIREGFGVAVAESIAAGTPVVTIAAPHNAAAKLIREGITGSLVPLDSLALADAVVAWLHAGEKHDITATDLILDWREIAQRQLKVYES